VTLFEVKKRMAIRELEPIRSLSKSQEVLQRLRDSIWSGDLVPGTPLREAHIAKQLNVSQVPVREALLQLKHLGLVVRVPDHGTTVTKLTRAEILEINEVRRHLEELAFQLAAKRMTAEVEAELRGHLSNMERMAASGDLFGVAEEDFSFHQAAWRASGNTVLSKTLEQLCTALYAFVSLKRHIAGELVESSADLHRKLLDLLLRGDVPAILAGVREHLDPSAVLPESISE
jgi:DNA-binding GntR family transcriptional regulator